MWTDYKSFFNDATGHLPFNYQEQLASAESLPGFLNVPTGAGKTAAVILAWMWRRFFHENHFIRENTPRRLIYCLPMRVLVEQTRDHAKVFRDRLAAQTSKLQDLSINVAMGGEASTEWLNHPDKNQIIIGTQDMLLSAALNRGYGMSRFKWPHAFGMLNAHCLWVFDEVQLMGAGLSTSAQLAAFRKQLKSYGANHSLWLSATLDRNWFKTPDYTPILANSNSLLLNDIDKKTPVLRDRLHANKLVSSVKLDASLAENDYHRSVAKTVVESHKPASQTLVVVNRVDRAQKIYQEIKKVLPETTKLLLIHSRYRPKERDYLNEQLKQATATHGRIIVATQVVEAGIDISSATLFTELAPWSSLVQRFGRCNRYGEHKTANIYWLDPGEENALPYTPEELNESKEILDQMENQSASPASLPTHYSAANHKHIIRKRDIIQLFDTTPDLSGHDVDVSRFVRDSQDVDLQVFWRQWDETRPPDELSSPRPGELCSVQLWNLASFLGKDSYAWRWDHIENNWQRMARSSLRPGMTLLLNCQQGGYSSELGWTGNKKEVVSTMESHEESYDSIGADQMAFKSEWQTIAEHTNMVVEVLENLLSSDLFDDKVKAAACVAARWHDAGKGHEVFQHTMSNCGIEPPRQDTWAKTPADNIRHKQPHFRHELASALAFLQRPEAWGEFEPWQSDLAAYLMASHHGKVRLSIRSMPEEKAPEGMPEGTRIARGVWEGSEIAETDLGGGVTLPPSKLNLSIMDLGWSQSPSWLDRMLSVRDMLGPFRLAYMESLLRSADILASQKVRKEVSDDD